MQVLKSVRLVNAQVVDAGGLERDARVLGGVQFGLQPFFGAQQRALQPLDGQPFPVFLPGVGQPGPHLVQFAVQVSLLPGRGQRDLLERRPGDDDPVPVTGRAPGGEGAAAVTLQVVAARDQHPGLRVELQPLAGELLQHVVGHDDGRLSGHAQAPQFRDAHDHFGGFARAHLVEQSDGWLVDHPGHRCRLVRARAERHRQAGQRQLGVVVAAQHEVVEPIVVDAGQAGGPAGVLPGPFGEPLAEFGGLLLGGEGVFHVENAALPGGGFDQVPDLDPALLHDGLGQRGSRVPAGPPGGGGQDAVIVPLDCPQLAAGVLHLQPGVIQGLAQELLDIVHADPRRAEPGVDLARGQVIGLHLPQLGHVDGEPGVVGRGLLGGAEFVADLAGQVLGGRDEGSRRCLSGFRGDGPGFAGDVAGGDAEPGQCAEVGGSMCQQVSRITGRGRGHLEYQGAQLLAGVGLGGAEQPGDLGQVSPAVGVQADGQGVGGGVGAQLRDPGGEDPLAEDRSFGGPLAGRVEFFQRVDERGERVVPEPALRRPDPGHDLLAGLRAGPAGAPLGVAVERAVGGEVGVIPAVQVTAQLADLGGVFGRSCLGVQQRPGGVPQAQQVPQLGGLAAGNLMRPLKPVHDPGERAVAGGAQVPLDLLRAHVVRGGRLPGLPRGTRRARAAGRWSRSRPAPG